MAKISLCIHCACALTLRIDYFNRTQAPFPITQISASNFGQVTTRFSGGNREGQTGVTFNF